MEMEQAWVYLRDIPTKVRGFSIEPLLGPMDFSLDDEGQASSLLDDVHQVIIGAESGPNRRPCKLEWIRDIVRQCKEAGVACYIKQIPTDELHPRAVMKSRISTRREEWPSDLRVQEWL